MINLAAQLRTQTTQAAVLDEDYRRAKGRYLVAFARAMRTAEGAMELRKQAAVEATADAWLEVELAEVRYRACQEELRFIRSSLDVGRTLSATVRSEWEQTAVRS